MRQCNPAVCVNYGISANPPVTFDLRSFYLIGGTSLQGFYLFHQLEHESAQSSLTRLSRLVEAHHLQPHIALEEPWEQFSQVVQQLMVRRFVGKAVLIFTPGLK